MIYLYAYDISDNHRRTQVYKKLGQFGVRIQKSIFQCDITAELAKALKSSLLRLIHETEDSLIIIPLCEKDQEKTERFGLELSVQYAGGPFAIL
jgi:CRISPR-associated protein Cas2